MGTKLEQSSKADLPIVAHHKDGDDSTNRTTVHTTFQRQASRPVDVLQQGYICPGCVTDRQNGGTSGARTPS
jgi:hypothetical protein